MLSYIGNNPVLFNGALLLPSRYVMALVSIIVLIGLQITFMLVVSRVVGVWSVTAGGVLLTIVVVLFLTTSCSDPGIIQRGVQQLDLVSTTYLKFCPFCQIWRPPRCKHCRQCDNCIDLFDHHCFFVGNCIGHRNRRSFVAFLFLAQLMLLADTITGGVFEARAYYMVPGGAGVGGVFRECRSGSALIVMAAVFLLVFVYMTIWNLYVIGKGITTYEYIKGTYRNGSNPYDHGWTNNLWHFLIDPIPRSQI